MVVGGEGAALLGVCDRCGVAAVVAVYDVGGGGSPDPVERLCEVHVGEWLALVGPEGGVSE